MSYRDGDPDHDWMSSAYPKLLVEYKELVAFKKECEKYNCPECGYLKEAFDDLSKLRRKNEIMHEALIALTGRDGAGIERVNYYARSVLQAVREVK